MSKLKELRNKSNLTYQAIAEQLGISKTFYWQIENRKRRLNYTMAIKIAAIFHLLPDEVFFDDLKEEVLLKRS